MNFNSDESSLFKKLELAKKVLASDSAEDSDDDCEDDFLDLIHSEENIRIHHLLNCQLFSASLHTTAPVGHWSINTPPPKI